MLSKLYWNLKFQRSTSASLSRLLLKLLECSIHIAHCRKFLSAYFCDWHCLPAGKRCHFCWVLKFESRQVFILVQITCLLPFSCWVPRIKIKHYLHVLTTKHFLCRTLETLKVSVLILLSKHMRTPVIPTSKPPPIPPSYKNLLKSKNYQKSGSNFCPKVIKKL